jgi:hypothetical protein
VEKWLEKNPKFRNLSPIEYLFKRFATLYPKRWSEQFRTNEELEDWKLCWAEEMADRGITFEEVKSGIERCIDLYNWPPSFPEFLKACRPSLDYEVAFHEAIDQMKKRNDGKEEKWSNPAIYWAAVKLGNDIMNTIYLNVKMRWKAALDEAINNVQAGILPREIPVRKISLPPPVRNSKRMSQVAIRELTKIKEILSRKPECGKNTEVGLKPLSENFSAAIGNMVKTNV